MDDLKVSIAQIAPKLGDVEANVELHLQAIDAARDAASDLVVFPELSLTGYHLGDQVPELALGDDSAPLRAIADASRAIDVVFGYVEDAPGHRFFNAAAYLSAGEPVHVHRKVYLPTYGMFQEGREFAAGARLRAFDTRHGRLGLLICEDLWHPTSGWLLTQQGAEVVITVGNGPTRGTRPGDGITSVGVWRDLVRTNAQFGTSFFLFVNRVGCEDGLTFGGGSTVADPFGRIVLELPPLEPALGRVELTSDVVRRARATYPLLRDSDLELVDRELKRIRSARYGITIEDRREPHE
ncbi:MAG TPA: nitrilase-related carbon-nitrogen hydrolase [Candidatus Polarisedimenticolaceae bacterium]|nr:nitrilase-related carbon-nitrogen hydrolase [Candidatus Polarisedimenticolaceae bacterium]